LIQSSEDVVKGTDQAVIKRSIALAAMGAFLDGYDLLIIGVVLLSLVPQWGLSSASMGMLGGAAFLGMIVGGGVFSIIADKIGRRAVFIVDMIVFILGAIACALAQNILQLIIFRFFIGMAIGMDAPTSTSIIAEFSGNKKRGRNTTFMQIFWPLGSVIAAIVGLLLYFYAGAHAWRWMLASGVIPALIVLIMRSKLPETPYWLKNKEMINTGEKSTSTIIAEKSKISKSAGSIKDLLQEPWLKPLFFISFFWFLTNIASGLFLYMAVISKRTFGLSEAQSIAFYAIVPLIVVVILIFLALKVIDQSGRRPMTIVGMALAATSAFVLAFTSQYELLTAVMFALMMVSNMAPGQGSYWAWSVELFPTRLRATGAGIATALGKTGSLIGTLLFPIVLDTAGWTITLIIYAFIWFIALILVIFYAPETKGTSLLELDRIDRETNYSNFSF
jgi:putative MFS transporter